MRYRTYPKKVTDVGRELNVDAVLEGAVAQSNDQIEITTRMIGVRGEKDLWQSSWAGNAAEALNHVPELACKIAGQIGVAITPTERKRIQQTGGRVDPQMYALLLKGRMLVSDMSDLESIRRGITLLQNVVARDPRNAAAWTAISEGWLATANLYIAPHDAIPKAREAAETALQCDPDFDAAHAALGRIRLFYDWDWDGARAEFSRAVELNPNSSAAHEGLGLLNVAIGRSDEGIRHVERALQVNPLSMFAHGESALVLADSRRYDEAIRAARRTLELEPRFVLARVILGVAHAQKGEYSEAIGELESAARMQAVPTAFGFLAYAYGAAGRSRDAERVLSRLVRVANKQYVCPFEVATGYITIERLDEAFEWMEKGLQARADCMIWLRSEPWLDGLRKDARYASLVKRIGFPGVK